MKSCKLLLGASPLRDLDRTPECMITRSRGELITRSGSGAAEALADGNDGMAVVTRSTRTHQHGTCLVAQLYLWDEARHASDV